MPLKLIIIAFKELTVRHQVRQLLVDMNAVDVLEAVNAKDLYHKCVEFHPEIVICDNHSLPPEEHYQKKLLSYCQRILLFSDNKLSFPKIVDIKDYPYPPEKEFVKQQINSIV